MRHRKFDIQLFEGDAQIIDRTGAASLIPEENAREIIQGVVTQSAVLQRGRKLPNMSSKTYKMPVLDMLPIAYFVNGDTGAKRPRSRPGIRSLSQRRRLRLLYQSLRPSWMILTMTSGERSSRG